MRLSDRAKAAWPIILLIASEDVNAKLPNAETVYRHLQRVGIQLNSVSFLKLIDEYIQGDFILKTTPELQSYRVQSTESKKEEYSSAREAPQGFASPTCIFNNQKEKRLGEEEVESPLLGQPNLASEWSTPWIEEVTNPLEASLIRLGCRRLEFVPRPAKAVG